MEILLCGTAGLSHDWSGSLVAAAITSLMNLAISKHWRGTRTRLVILTHTKRSLSFGRFQALKIQSSAMEIFVDNKYEENFTVRLGASDRLRDLMTKIQAKTRMLICNEMVCYGGTRMRMNWRLSSYDLRDGCTVHLSIPILFCKLPPRCFVDLENKDALQRIPLTYHTGQKWSQVHEGLSIEGKCTSMSCEAFGRRVISPIRFIYMDNMNKNSFNIMTDEAPCPMCRCTVEATTCGFIDCLWMYTGRLKGSKAKITSEWQLADDNKYERFREAGKQTNLVRHSNHLNALVWMVVYSHTCGKWGVSDQRLHVVAPGNMVDWEVLIISAKPSRTLIECDMCLRYMSFSDEKERLACGCRFHSKCMAEWKERETGCPNCRLEESTSHSPVEVIDSKPKKRKSFWRLCQG